MRLILDRDLFFFFQAEDGIRDGHVTGVQTCALPISRDDALREGGPDSREPRDLRHVGAVEVDALTGQERSREPGGLPRDRGEPARGRRIHGHKSHVAGRRGLRGGERQSHTRAREGEEGEQEGGFPIIHGCTLTTRQPAVGTRLTHATPENCRCTSVTAPTPPPHHRPLVGTRPIPCLSYRRWYASTGSRSPPRRSRGCPPSAARRGRRSGCASRRG